MKATKIISLKARKPTFTLVSVPAHLPHLGPLDHVVSPLLDEVFDNLLLFLDGVRHPVGTAMGGGVMIESRSTYKMEVCELTCRWRWFRGRVLLLVFCRLSRCHRPRLSRIRSQLPTRPPAGSIQTTLSSILYVRPTLAFDRLI